MKFHFLIVFLAFSLNSFGQVEWSNMSTTAQNAITEIARTVAVQNVTTTGNVASWGSVVYVDATAANVVLTLPTTVTQDGKSITIIRTDATANTVTIAAFSGQTLYLLNSGSEVYQSKGSLTITASGTTVTQSSNIGVTPVIRDISGVEQHSAGTGTNLSTITSTNNANSGTLLPTGNRVVLTGATVQGSMTVNAANGTIAVSKAGTYAIVVTVSMQSAGTTGQWGQLVKNNATVLAASSAYSQASSAGMQVVLNYTGLFAVGDLIDVRLNSTAAGTIGVTGYSYSVIQESVFFPVIGYSTQALVSLYNAFHNTVPTAGMPNHTGGVLFTPTLTGTYAFSCQTTTVTPTNTNNTSVFNIRNGTTVLATQTTNAYNNGNHPMHNHYIEVNLMAGVQYNITIGGSVRDANDMYIIQYKQVGTNAISSFANLVPSDASGNTVQVDQTKNVLIGTNTPVGKLTVDAGVTANTTITSNKGTINDFLQFDIQNLSTGTSAQSGYSATANDGTATTKFVWLGKNNSLFNNPQLYNVGGAGDGTVMNDGGNFWLHNSGTTGRLAFSTGIATTPFYTERMSILNTNGNVGIGNITPTSTFQVTGAVSFPFTSTATSLTVTAVMHTINCNNVATAITITLPTPVGITGRIYIVKRDAASVGAVTVATSAGLVQSLAGTFGATTTLSASGSYGQSIHFQSDGTNWHRIN